MKTVTGIFSSFDQALRSARELKDNGIGDESINLLAPDTSPGKLDRIPSTTGEQPGMGKAVGGVVGTAIGTAAGAQLGMAVASAVLPGVGPTIAIGLAAAALLGVTGAFGGAAAGGSLENALTEGLPKDEVFVYEDALKQGRAVVIVLARDEEQADLVREILKRNNAEDIDAAREQWWVGTRDAEKEHYIREGQDVAQDEREFRLGFESALHWQLRGSSYDEASALLRNLHPETYRRDTFRRGFERGQHYGRGLTSRNHERKHT
jgi:hypothetical protein